MYFLQIDIYTNVPDDFFNQEVLLLMSMDFSAFQSYFSQHS